MFMRGQVTEPLLACFLLPLQKHIASLLYEFSLVTACLCNRMPHMTALKVIPGIRQEQFPM